MTHDAATRAGRLTARARRPALDPWALTTVYEVEADRGAPRFVAPASPSEAPRGLEHPARRPTVSPEPHAGEHAPETATGVTAVAPPVPPVRPSRLRAVEPDPTPAGEGNGEALPGTPAPAPSAATTGADPSSRHVERAPLSHGVAPAPASLRPASRAPADPVAERAHVLGPAPGPATTSRPPEVPTSVDSGPSGATIGHPARHQPPIRVAAAVTAGEPETPVRAVLEPALPPPERSTPSPSPSPSVVIDEIRIVTPPAAGPARDPLASLAAQRVGASRHRGGERWRA
jgi:hypothetical protein